MPQYEQISKQQVSKLRRKMSCITALAALLLVNSISAVTDGIEADFSAIEEAVLKLNRPDFMEIPHLLQNINVEAGYSTYKWAEDVEGIPDYERNQAVLTRKSNDHHVKTIIFPSGHFHFGQKLNRSYVVLRRHSTEKEIFFFNLAYLRDENSHIVVEWTTYDPKLYHKSIIERELCQEDACDFPEWILGTCPFKSHVCKPNTREPDTFSLNVTTSHATNLSEISIAATKKREVLDLPNPVQNINHRKKRSGIEDPLVVASESHDVSIRALRNKNLPRVAAPNPSNASPDHIPDSFDLLQLEQDDSSGSLFFLNHVRRRDTTGGTNSEEDGDQRNKDYSRIVAQLIRHSANCIDCQTVGPYFGDLEERPELSQVLGVEFRKEFEGERNKIRLTNEGDFRRFKVPYIGYGSCKHSHMILALQHPKSQEIDDIIEFYLSTLRVECRHSLVTEIRSWLTTKLRFLHIQPDLSLKILPASPLLKYASLTSEEYEMMVSALIFYKYTVVYLQEKTLGHGGTGNPTGLQHSRRLLFIRRLFLEVIETIREHFSHHIIKLTRTLARMLKNKFYSLLQEKLAIDYQMTLSHAKEGIAKQRLERKNLINYNDRVQIMGLKEFVLYGLGPTMKSSTPTANAYRSFYSLNSKRIKLLVDIYGFDYDTLNVLDLDQPLHSS